MNWTGSSPLTRGTPGPLFAYLDMTRFIPAYAGNTGNPSLDWHLSSVHPRLRGEHKRRRPHKTPACGSSPLTRGTLDLSGKPSAGERFIPAYAGNTTAQRFCDGGQPVHPRLRGEHANVQVMPLRSRRFIPAYAGNTSTRQVDRLTRPVHPRLRGEHLGCYLYSSLGGGSSPLTRGTLHISTGLPSMTRFIPAYAGNTPNPSA